jgi:hypothetical protein
MYEPGALRVAMKPKDVPMFDSTELPLAYLDHSCDEWVIGHAEHIRALIADLQKALKAIGKNTEK